MLRTSIRSLKKAAAPAVRATPAQKSAALRKMLQSKKLEFIMEAHSGLSARIVEETGFKGIWASGLSISALTGYRDNNELSHTQVLQIVEYMADATDVPILLDGDTGYGNFNNARLLVKKLEQLGVAGVCIEDKIFPKTNSLLDNVKQPLATIEEFSGKIRAMKDTQRDPNFNVVARIEALIAGWGIEEAIKRGEAYAKAGADAIVVHSKKKTPEQIEGFMKHWKHQCPVIIIPTAYPNHPVSAYENWGISLIIWANHNVRASISAMEKISAEIYKNGSIAGIDAKVAPVNRIFELQHQQEYLDAETKYLPTS